MASFAATPGSSSQSAGGLSAGVCVGVWAKVAGTAKMVAIVAKRKEVRRLGLIFWFAPAWEITGIVGTVEV